MKSKRTPKKKHKIVVVDSKTKYANRPMRKKKVTIRKVTRKK